MDIEKLKEFFDAADASGDGMVHAMELIQMVMDCKKCDRNDAMAIVHGIMKKCDKDEDMKLSWEEFLNGMQEEGQCQS